MSEENKNLENEGLNPEFELPETNLNFNEAESEGINVVEGGLENYQETEEEVEEDDFDYTFEEIKKHLRAIRKKEDINGFVDVTDDEVENITDEDKEKIKEYLNLKERKAIYKFVYNKKTVSDDDVKDMTDEEFVDLTAKAFAKSQHFNYAPKKDFGVAYKKKRQRKNKVARRSRAANRK